jgi:hypothetical protein
MSAHSIISHRMYVAALSHDANGTTGNRPPDRVPNSAPGYTETGRGVSPEYREPKPKAVVARRLLFATMTKGV